jgi:hypothetical protein
LRTARMTMLLAVALAAPCLLVGVVSDGPYAGRVLQGGLVVLVLAGAAAVWMWRRGARLDREQDERGRLILGKTAVFTCLVAAVAIQAYWAWHFAAGGNEGDDFFWVLVVCWAAFAGSYLYNTLRS